MNHFLSRVIYVYNRNQDNIIQKILNYKYQQIDNNLSRQQDEMTTMTSELFSVMHREAAKGKDRPKKKLNRKVTNTKRIPSLITLL